jgi:hypothetical protein
VEATASTLPESHEAFDNPSLNMELATAAASPPSSVPKLLPPNLFAVLSSTAHIMNVHAINSSPNPSSPLTFRGEIVGEMIRGLGAAMACGWNDSRGSAASPPVEGGVYHDNREYDLNPGALVGGVLDVLVNGTRWREFEHSEAMSQAEVELREAVENTFLRIDTEDRYFFQFQPYLDVTEIHTLGISDRLVQGGAKGDYGTLP